MNPPAKPWGRETFALLRPGPFRRYIIGACISDTGTWMQMMAQGWVMSGLTNKAVMLGLVNFASGLPMIFLTMIAAVIGGLFVARRQAFVVYGDRAAQTEWDAWREDAKELSKGTGPVARRAGGCGLL